MFIHTRTRSRARSAKRRDVQDGRGRAGEEGMTALHIKNRK